MLEARIPFTARQDFRSVRQPDGPDTRLGQGPAVQALEAKVNGSIGRIDRWR